MKIFKLLNLFKKKSIKIQEQGRVHEQWYEDAGKQDIRSLKKFIRHLLCDYEHDYGTICHAVAASAVAAAHAANKLPQGGITGFQASAVMWEFISHWTMNSNKCGLSLRNWDNMLYPQYEHTFEKTISPGIWESIQKEAKERLAHEDQSHVCQGVWNHWQSIATGRIPFGYVVAGV